jgi:hypothetical protein
MGAAAEAGKAKYSVVLWLKVISGVLVAGLAPGLILVYMRPARGIGIPLVVLAVSAAPLFIALEKRAVRPGDQRQSRVGVSAVGVLVAATAITAMSVAGLLVRYDGADYVGWYGTRAQASVPDRSDCSHGPFYVKGGSDPNWDCHGSWTVDGQTHTGKVVLAAIDDPYGGSPNSPIDVYAVGDTAFSVARVGKAHFTVAIWGLFPVAPLAVTAPLMVLALLCLRWARWSHKWWEEVLRERS